ncbi:hypothetical protein EWB00_008810 [Schistosoma japonicum]|uniref:Uncharacterized protein n=1 Tax=Schistosoma japonicum TaxID=6182 RepID=A0A4Z2CNX0_SCHJA|nr:hypothetical protein EWB00_008810 [Schistosoma japonicum]
MAQIDKDSEYVTHVKQRTTFNNDPDNAEQHSVDDVDNEGAFNKDSHESNVNNNEISDYTDTDEKPQDYVESGYVDEDITRYEKEIRKRRGISQQFKHVPKNSITEYNKFDHSLGFNKMDGPEDDAFTSKDYRNTDLDRANKLKKLDNYANDKRYANNYARDSYQD